MGDESEPGSSSGSEEEVADSEPETVDPFSQSLDGAGDGQDEGADSGSSTDSAPAPDADDQSDADSSRSADVDGPGEIDEEVEAEAAKLVAELEGDAEDDSAEIDEEVEAAAAKLVAELEGDSETEADAERGADAEDVPPEGAPDVAPREISPIHHGEEHQPSTDEEDGDAGDAAEADAETAAAESDVEASDAETVDAEASDAETVDAESADAETVDAEAADAETAADDGAGAADSDDVQDSGMAGAYVDDDLFSGPDSDQEMPLAQHIEEMMRRLSVVVAVGVVVTLVAYPVAADLINYFWGYHIPDPAVNRPRVYGPLELILTKLKVAGLAGIVAGLPVLVYESYRFMRPGLYPRERRYYLAAIPTSLVLALIGVAFAHFVVLPAIFSYFTAYTEGTAVIAFGLRETFNLILLLMGYMAIVFQIPLFVMLAIMMNLVTRLWLEDKRLLFWGAFAGLSFLVSPDPTGMAPIIIAATMIVLFEGTLALLRWTGN